MRRATFLLIASFAVSLPAVPAENGTYRPGQAYYSSPVSSPDQCAAQCQGDAQCKGWNFIRPRQAVPAGVCELNAFQVLPVPSPVSISGDSQNVRSSSRIIPSGTNTITIGALPTMPRAEHKQRPQQQQTRAPQPRTAMRVLPEHSRQLPPRSLARAQVSAQPPTPKPQFNYQLDSANIPRRPLPAQPQFMQPNHQTLGQSLNAQPRRAASVKRPAQQLRHNLDRRASIYRERDLALTSSQPKPAHSIAAAGKSQAPAFTVPARADVNAQVGMMAPAPRPVQIQRRREPLSVSHQSLFGSLHDDVSVSVPLALTAKNMPRDPDAPIATVTSVRTKPVQTRVLGELAGAP